jgi:hypothetical protein
LKRNKASFPYLGRRPFIPFLGFGALLPLVAAKLIFDPPVVASPAPTAIVHITGLSIFFVTVRLLPGI